MRAHRIRVAKERRALTSEEREALLGHIRTSLAAASERARAPAPASEAVAASDAPSEPATTVGLDDSVVRLAPLPTSPHPEPPEPPAPTGPPTSPRAGRARAEEAARRRVWDRLVGSHEHSLTETLREALPRGSGESTSEHDARVRTFRSDVRARLDEPIVGPPPARAARSTSPPPTEAELDAVRPLRRERRAVNPSLYASLGRKPTEREVAAAVLARRRDRAA